jgi:ubiquitin-protein ligase
MSKLFPDGYPIYHSNIWFFYPVYHFNVSKQGHICCAELNKSYQNNFHVIDFWI